MKKKNGTLWPGPVFTNSSRAIFQLQLPLRAFFYFFIFRASQRDNTDTQTHRHTDTQTDTYTNQTGRQTGRPAAGWQAGGDGDGEGEREASEKGIGKTRAHGSITWPVGRLPVRWPDHTCI